MAAGGIVDGRSLAASLSYGASDVWVGTRFVASADSGASNKHKELVLSAGYDDVIRTLIYSDRPMSVRKTYYEEEWETKRAKGLMGWVAGSIKDIKPAKEIVDELVSTAAKSLNTASSLQIVKGEL